jgi:integrase
VRQLSEHYHKSPELITEEELPQYFLFIKNVKHYSRNTSTVAICGIKFFFEKTLNRNWATFGLLRAPREKKLPVILSREEVRQILARVRLPRYKVCLTTIYSCGLRLQEGTNLRVADIDSARLMIHVRTAKAPKIVTSLYRNERCSCCANIGSSITIPYCSFPQKAVTISTWRALPSQCLRAACRTVSTRR